jgi:hypothetical protein
MSELIKRLREYWHNDTAVARREWRNEHGAIAVVESEHRYTSVVLIENGKLTILPYEVWDRHRAMKDAEAIAQFAGAEEVTDEPMERLSGM